MARSAENPRRRPCGEPVGHEKNHTGLGSEGSDSAASRVPRFDMDLKYPSLEFRPETAGSVLWTEEGALEVHREPAQNLKSRLQNQKVVMQFPLRRFP